MTQTDSRFEWVEFYEEFADKLLEYKDRRGELTTKFIQAIRDSPIKFPITDRYPAAGREPEERPLTDIDPFSVMGSINIFDSDEEDRTDLCKQFKAVLGIDAAPPTSFRGVPMYPRTVRRWFELTGKRGETQRMQDIDKLWRAFEVGIQFADSDGGTNPREFVEAFDEAANVPQVGHRLPSGLYWSRPNFFPTLERHSKDYLRQVLRMPIPKSKKVLGEQYLSIRNDLLERVDSGTAPFSSFQELSHRALRYKPGDADTRITEIGQQLSDEGEFTPKNEPEARDKVDTSIAQRRGQPAFRHNLINAYGTCCAITGCDAVEALEAAHIRQYKEADLNDVRNGLLLRADIHTLFDRHLIGIDHVSGKVWIAELLKGTQYAELEDTKARSPKNIKDKPDPDALRELWEKAKELGRVN